MQDVLAVTTIVVVGMLVGVEFSVSAFVNPIFDRLPTESGIAARSDGARVLGRLMPFWYIGSVALGAVWTALAWGDDGAAQVGAATALLMVSVVMSVLLLVPIASRSATWSSTAPPADWKEQSKRWDRYHVVRVGVIVLAFALFAVALVV